MIGKTIGPISYENWKATLQGKPAKYSFEFPLFTDTHITGQITEGCGPYQFLNTVPVFKQNLIAPSIILRVDNHIEEEPPPEEMTKTNTALYHGGGLTDEIAALMSLCVGIRLKAGGCTRRFDSKGDPRGKPEMHSLHLDPILVKPQGFPPVLPYAVGSHCINDAHLLPRFHEASPNDAITLIRAARLYQDAVWIAESEPSLSWIYLVSAIEAAAGHWRKEKESPIQQLRAFKPELEAILQPYGGDELTLKVAELISDYMGSTRKFLDFILAHLPKPPDKRPPEFAQHPWDSRSLEKSLGIIYRWRSGALHGGTPFPDPMCHPPLREGNNYWEKPPGSAAKSKGAVWKADDMPMLLYLFEYIVRNSLLLWWKSIVQANPST